MKIGITSISTAPLRHGIIFFILALLFVGFPALAEAQTGGFAGSYTRMGFGPRGMASGNAMSAAAENGIYSHYNPALSAQVDNTQIDFSSALMSFDRTLHGLNVTFPLPPHAGLSVGLLNANVSDIDGRTSSGYDTGDLSTHEYQLFVSFGINLGRRARIGTSVKFLLADFHDDISSSTGTGFDIGLIVEPIDHLKAAIVAQDLIAGYTWNTDDLYSSQDSRNRSDEFPNRFKFNLTYEPSSDWFVSAEYEIQRIESEYFDRSVTGDAPARSRRNVDNIVTDEHQFRMGGGFRVHDRLTMRSGIEILNLDDVDQTFKPSAGFSLHLPFDQYEPTIDYAWVREPTGISHMHVLALQLNL